MAPSRPTSPGYVRRVMHLGFLAPDVVEGIIAKCLTAEKGVVELTDLDIPLSWKEQRRLFQSATEIA
jgi:hypothetical protein